MASLRLCPSCSRHVRLDETRCPFCSGALSVPTRIVVRRSTRAILTRAALFFAGTSVVTACEKATETSTFDEPDGAVDAGMASPFYGVPPIDSGGPDVNDADADGGD